MQSSRKCEMFSLYWWTKHWAWFEKRREEPKKGLNVWWEDEPLVFWKF
jgi:hypothetical protein